MKKVPLRIRLMLITGLVLLLCCFTMYFCVLSSAVMKLDSIQAGMLNFQTDEDTEIIMNISLEEVFPEIGQIISDTKADFTRQTILITILVLIIGALASYFASGFALRPIHTLSEAVADTTEQNLYEPLSLPQAKDEVYRLTESFNRMRKSLSDAFTAQKQFSANAAHELRTPLAVMQTSMEVFLKKEDKSAADYEETLTSSLTQLSRMNHLVDTLLSFQTMHTAELTDLICVSELTEEICCDLISLALDKGIEFETAGESQGKVKGNETLIYQAIYNLCENAIKYNREGGTVLVNTEDTGEGVLISVVDSGMGIPEEQWIKIFDPFYRVDKSRSRKAGGSGLGLAMVAEIAKLHGGRVYVEKSSSLGSTICLLLPICL